MVTLEKDHLAFTTKAGLTVAGVAALGYISTIALNRLGYVEAATAMLSIATIASKSLGAAASTALVVTYVGAFAFSLYAAKQGHLI